MRFPRNAFDLHRCHGHCLLLSLKRLEQGGIPVAKDGKSLGYVADDHLMRVL